MVQKLTQSEERLIKYRWLLTLEMVVGFAVFGLTMAGVISEVYFAEERAVDNMLVPTRFYAAILVACMFVVHDAELKMRHLRTVKRLKDLLASQPVKTETEKLKQE